MNKKTHGRLSRPLPRSGRERSLRRATEEPFGPAGGGDVLTAFHRRTALALIHQCRGAEVAAVQPVELQVGGQDYQLLAGDVVRLDDRPFTSWDDEEVWLRFTCEGTGGLMTLETFARGFCYLG